MVEEKVALAPVQGSHYRKNTSRGPECQTKDSDCGLLNQRVRSPTVFDHTLPPLKHNKAKQHEQKTKNPSVDKVKVPVVRILTWLWLAHYTCVSNDASLLTLYKDLRPVLWATQWHTAAQLQGCRDWNGGSA